MLGLLFIAGCAGAEFPTTRNDRENFCEHYGFEYKLQSYNDEGFTCIYEDKVTYAQYFEWEQEQKIDPECE